MIFPRLLGTQFLQEPEASREVGTRQESTPLPVAGLLLLRAWRGVRVPEGLRGGKAEIRWRCWRGPQGDSYLSVEPGFTFILVFLQNDIRASVWGSACDQWHTRQFGFNGTVDAQAWGDGCGSE